MLSTVTEPVAVNYRCLTATGVCSVICCHIVIQLIAFVHVTVIKLFKCIRPLKLSMKTQITIILGEIEK